MAHMRDQDDFALLMQETMVDMKEQREQNQALLQQNQQLLSKVSELLENAAAGTQDSIRRRRNSREKVTVTLQTRVRQIYTNAYL